MTQLIQNRYNQTSPTSIQETGLSISVPIYIQPTTEQNKQLLNAFREVKRQQLLEMGHQTTRVQGSIVVETAQAEPKTPVELELGMDENNLRYALFNRHGVNERLIIKLQQLTGLELVTKEQIEAVTKAWLHHLFPNSYDGTEGTTKTSKTSTRPKTNKSSSKSSTELV